VILVFVVSMYRRDAVELPGWLGVLLTLLRTAAFVGLFILFLQPQWRAEHEIVHNSRVLLLVDTSGSMGLGDPEPGQSTKGPTRLEQIADALEKNDVLAKLRKTHDVAVFQFNDSLQRDRMISLGKLRATGAAGASGEDAAAGEPEQAAEKPPKWREWLVPGGTETHLGDALGQLIGDERSKPVSGIILFSDGRQNGQGISPDAATAEARKAKIPVYVIGMGSDRMRSNASVYDLAAPKRAFPGDHYTVSGALQAHGMAGRKATVVLTSRDTAAGQNAPAKEEARQEVILGADGDMLPLKFDLTPEKDKLGRRTLRLEVLTPKEDAEAADNVRETEVEIIARKNRVLLLAGGPTRDYQYLRTVLYRDKSNECELLLQTAQPGPVSQESKLIDEFPTEREALYQYDCIVAFDADWKHLGPWEKTTKDGRERLERRATTQQQIDLLENWVGDGGGLVVVAGPVFTCQPMDGWLQDPHMAKIRNLYPVEFQRQSLIRETTFFNSKDVSPVKLTPEGLEKDYLWLAGTAPASAEAWGKFGVYSVCPVRGLKGGATALAHFTDPAAAVGDKKPPYLAEHRYGAGWVFYIGSGEIWRLREQDPGYFDQFYVKVLRHVSQERLQQGSSRGRLVVVRGDKYAVGSTVDVRAEKITNLRLEPLTAAMMPNLKLQVVPQEKGDVRTVLLYADPTRAGTYAGQFPVLQPGKYRLELLLPESRDERLTRAIEVRVPRLETENSQRYDAQLSRIAKDSGDEKPGGRVGKYYVSLDAAFNPKPVKSESAAAAEADKPLAEQLKDMTKTEILPEDLPPEEEEARLMWMMFGICGVLCMEWLVRRLMKLA
jgi:hypothetical protein